MRYSQSWLHALVLSIIVVGGAACRKSSTDAPDQGVDTMVGCKTDSDCPANLPSCLGGELGAHVCVGCIVGMNTCNPGYECDNGSHTCQLLPPGSPQCVRDSDCPPLGVISEASICQLSSGVCVECEIDDDCSGGSLPVCDNGYNIGIPDLGHVPTFKCINGCDLCIPPYTCDAVNKVCV